MNRQRCSIDNQLRIIYSSHPCIRRRVIVAASVHTTRLLKKTLALRNKHRLSTGGGAASPGTATSSSEGSRQSHCRLYRLESLLRR